MVSQEEPRSPSEGLEPGPANPASTNGDDNPPVQGGTDASNGADPTDASTEADDEGATDAGKATLGASAKKIVKRGTTVKNAASSPVDDDPSDDSTPNGEVAPPEAEEDGPVAVEGELAGPDAEAHPPAADVDSAEPSDPPLPDEPVGETESDDTTDLDPLDVAVLDLTAELTDAEAAFLAHQPAEAITDAVALDLSDRVDLDAELDRSGPEDIEAASWSATDGPDLAPPAPGLVTPVLNEPTPAPARARLTSRRRRMRARKVRRIIRYIDPWSVLKFSLLFYSAVFVIVMIAGVLLWSAAVSSGTVDNIEDFIKDLLALSTFSFEPDQIFRASALGGAILVVASTAGTVLLAILFNLISDLIGGIRVTVVELETTRQVAPESAPEPTSVPSE